MTSEFSHAADIPPTAPSSALRDVASERRQALSLVHYWDHVRGRRPMPLEDDLDLEHELLSNIWHQCFIVELSEDSVRYTYLGEAIENAYDDELAGAEVDGMASLNASKLVGSYKEVVATKRPVLHSGEFDNGCGNVVKFRQCLLPLGKEQVDVILGYLNYYVYAKL